MAHWSLGDWVYGKRKNHIFVIVEMFVVYSR